MRLEEFVSIGIRAHNEEESIARMLSHIFRQSIWAKIPKERREIVVCANGCTDRTVEIAREIAKKHPELKVIELKEKSFTRATNTLIRKMDRRATALLFFDADTIVHHKAAERMVEALRKKGTELVGANLIPSFRFVPKEEVNTLARVAAKYSEAKVGPNYWKSISGGGFAVKPSARNKIILPENVSANEDQYMTAKIGLEKTCRVKDAKVFFRRATNIKDLRNQRIRAIMGAMFLEREFPGLKRELDEARPPMTREKHKKFIESLSPEEKRVFEKIFLRMVDSAKHEAERRIKKNEFHWAKIHSAKLGKRKKP